MQLEQLNEALRFGNREASQVLKMKNQIMIGIEYEFHVDDADSSDEDNIDEDSYLEAIDEYVDEEMTKKDETLRELWVESEEDNARDVLDDFENALNQINEFVDEVGNPSEVMEKIVEYQEYWDTNSSSDWKDISKVREAVSFLYDINQTIDRFLRGVDKANFDDSERYVDGQDLIEELLDDADRIDIMEEPDMSQSDSELMAWFMEDGGDIADEAYNVLDLVGDVKGEFVKSTEGHIDDAVDRAREQAEDMDLDELYHMMEGKSRDDYMDDIRTEAYDNVDISDHYLSDGNDAVSIVTEDWSDPDNEWGISMRDFVDVTTDPSVDEGVEAITKPLPLEHALQVMEQVFQYIDDKGSTSERTGMHVNISIKGMDLRNLDKMKMVMLMDENFIRSHGKYPIRNYVAMMATQNYADIIELASTYVDQGVDIMVDKAHQTLISDVKHQSINFMPIGDANPATRRLELRYFGGANYHFREKEMTRDILQAAYVIKAASDPDFARKEYMLSLFRFLDKKVRLRGTDKSFMELVTKIRDRNIDKKDGFKLPQISKPNLP